MNYTHFFDYFLLGFSGALSVELLKAYELRGKLHLDKYIKIYRSFIFWAVLIGMCTASGFIAWAINADLNDVRILQVVVSGIGVNSFVRKVIEAKTANGQVDFGEDEEITIKDLFS